MASRKSARLTAKAETVATQLTQKVKSVPPLQNKQTKANEKTKTPQGPRKKQKTSNKQDASNDDVVVNQSSRSRAKGKGRNSKFMMDIPLDVLLEIFGLLEPIDLLHLSRVSRGLHDLLTSDDLVFLWKLTYKNVAQYDQPPFCPDNTNIVFYTNYVYGRHCQFCSSIHGRVYHESAFIRLCSKCAGDSFLSWRGHEVDSTVRYLCNPWILPQFQSAGHMILKLEYKRRLKEAKQFRKDKTASYFGERKLDVDRRVSVAHCLAQWRRRMQDSQLRKLRTIRHQREADIKKKVLEEEGYKADADMITYHAHRMPHVRKSRALTDSEWSLIRADILDFLQDIRENRTISNMRSKLQWRITQLNEFISQWKIRPRVWWVASSEPIASFIKSGLPADIPKAEFEKIEPQLRNVITSWREETDRYLTDLIPQPSGKGKKKDSCHSKTNVLELAATLFKCYWCTEPISYPRILMHGCFLKDVEDQEAAGGDEVGMDDMDDDLEGDVAVDARGPRAPRPPKQITFDTIFPTLSDYYSLGMCAGKEGVTYDEEASNVARDIITACGQDPMTVTYATMEGMHARLECLRCSRARQAKQKTKSIRLVMKWTMALVHELEEHYGEPPSSEPAWGKVDSLDDLAKVYDAEIKNRKKYKNGVSCNHCLWTGVTLQQQTSHVMRVHGLIVNEVTVSDHVSPPLDTSIKALYPAVKI